MVSALWALILSYVLAQENGTYFNGTAGDDTVAGNLGNDPVDGKYTIVAEGIRASFVPYGASVANLFVNDSKGVERDVVYGFDEAWMYSIGQHGYWGAIPGRYANRIVNSTFTIDGVTSHIIPNENNNTDTIHGGPNGWSYRNFTVVAHTTDSLTFSITDQPEDQGFPGQVVAFVTYTVTPYQWHERIVAVPTTDLTPIMLTSHVYWNLDGWADPDTETALNHTLYLPYAGLRINVTETQVPTGHIDTNFANGPFDFWTAPKEVGFAFDDPALNRSCGKTCLGYNVGFLTSRVWPYDWHNDPVATLHSDWSGIQLDVYTEQEGMQLYSCNNQNGK